jgi:5-methylcytosine-specific restriction protein B
LVTKSLATYFPEHFLPIYAAEHLRRFVTLLGGQAEADAPAWRNNRRFLELVRSREEFRGWTGQEVMHFLYAHFDPRPRQRTIWKIAPVSGAGCGRGAGTAGSSASGGTSWVISASTRTNTELKQALDAHWPRSSGGSLTLARRLLAFRDLEAGDRLVANRGVDEVLATGTVDGSYRSDPERPELQHVVPVTWDVSHAQKLASPQHGWRSTFAKVDPALFAKFTTHDGDSAPSARQAHDGAPVALPEDVHGVLDALARKGQVILHGPPGTGKTRLALGAALALAVRCSPGSPKSLCPALPRVSPPNEMQRDPAPGADWRAVADLLERFAGGEGLAHSRGGFSITLPGGEWTRRKGLGPRRPHHLSSC